MWVTMRFIVLLLSLVVLISCSKQETPTQLQKINQQNKIRIGFLVGQSTYYLSGDGEEGFEYELAAAFADFLGVELEVVPFFSLSDLFPRLNNNNIDIVASGLTINKNRLESFRFAPEYRSISQKLVFKQGNVRPRNFAQIKGNLTVLAKSSHVDSLRKAQLRFNDLTWLETDEMDEAELLQQVIDGEVDYTIADSNTLALFRRYHPELSIGFSVTRSDPVAWMLKKDNDDSLYALLVEFFGEAQQTGLIHELEEKYFGHVRQFNYINTLSFINSVKTTLPKYQPWFEEYALDLDWRLLAALSYQESMWDPKAKSPTGVRGIMMLTRPTAKHVGVTNRLEPEQNIKGGAIYLSRLLSRIPDRIPSPDNLWFALAAYNVGWGHVNDARILTQKDGADADKWAEVKKRLPLLIKKRYYRTTKYGYARGDVAVTYVDNIRRYYDTLVWLDENASTEETLQIDDDQSQQFSDPITLEK
ncbi:membrane-bound lytic murein transglycosylase MltF [Pseudoalteromonas ulvae]|uniref:membrane-bound lytic murein transglycosylase MltF n=1 Tax=Pseudoalteromonas ulvae TaxID=107327 RepID=UPI00186B73A5|nr:membrane-bound lytic murein transglycosylase MltF [Pseudoalteromonas ulvae]